MHLQDFLKSAGDYSCLAEDYIYAVLDKFGLAHDYRDVTLLTTLYTVYSKEIGVDKEFFVQDPVKLMEETAQNIFGKEINVSVVKQDITSFKDLPFDRYAAVRFDYSGHSHWVLSYNQQRIFDSMKNSQCVRLGKPTTARIIDIEIVDSVDGKSE